MKVCLISYRYGWQKFSAMGVAQFCGLFLIVFVLESFHRQSVYIKSIPKISRTSMGSTCALK